MELNLAERTSPPSWSPEVGRSARPQRPSAAPQASHVLVTPVKATSFRLDAPVFVPRDLAKSFETPEKKDFVEMRSQMSGRL